MTRYVERSLQLKATFGTRFAHLPPTEVDANFEPSSNETAAIDQQRQLYAGAAACLVDAQLAEQWLGELLAWHDAYTAAFVDESGVACGKVRFGPNGEVRERVPELKANLRFTYALEGSALLARALDAAGRPETDRVAEQVLWWGETFAQQFADEHTAGRWFLYEKGQVTPNNPSQISRLSHNNSQSYLIKGMESLAALRGGERWRERLRALLLFIATQRDHETGLLHEFHFSAGGWEPKVVEDTTDELNLKWQSQNGHETIIFGHTLAGLFVGPAAQAIRDGEPAKVHQLTRELIKTANHTGAIHENGLTANAFELVSGSPGFVEKTWPEGAWQVELLWQFLLHSRQVGVDLAEHQLADGRSLDEVFARGFALHDSTLFDGVVYVQEAGKPLENRGRLYADPINHAAETLLALHAL